MEKALEAEQRLQEEIEAIKAERDARYAELQKQLDRERENYKQKLRDLDGKGTSAQAKQTEQLLAFEKERAKWEQEKSYIQNQKDDAMDAQQRLEKKVESLLRENEKLKNDIKANRKLYSAAGAGAGAPGQPVGLGAPSGFHANMIGKGVMDKYGGGVTKSTVLGPGAFTSGGLLGNKDGSGTERSTYAFPTPAFGGGAPTILPPREDKSFVSPGGGNHGAVSALNLVGAGLASNLGGGHQSASHLDNSYVMKNILNTPSSGKSKSGISEQDALDLQKHQ